LKLEAQPLLERLSEHGTRNIHALDTRIYVCMYVCKCIYTRARHAHGTARALVLSLNSKPRFFLSDLWNASVSSLSMVAQIRSMNSITVTCVNSIAVTIDPVHELGQILIMNSITVTCHSPHAHLQRHRRRRHSHSQRQRQRRSIDLRVTQSSGGGIKRGGIPRLDCRGMRHARSDEGSSRTNRGRSNRRVIGANVQHGSRAAAELIPNRHR
jgi:hypothetical protein